MHRLGTRFVVLQSGVIARFTFQGLLLQLTTSLTLLVVAKLVVDMIGTTLPLPPHVFPCYSQHSVKGSRGVLGALPF